MSKIHNPPQEYYALLAEFVDEYARIESTMSAILRMSLGVHRHTAQVLFSGTRVSKAIDFIKRAHVARGATLHPMLERAFPKIAELTEVRDRLLHFGGIFREGAAIATNRYRNIPSKQYWLEFSLVDMKLIVEDTVTAHGCLVSFWLEKRPRKNVKRLAEWFTFAQRPWRYKFPSQANNQGKSGKAAHKR
jgi:hypothetical protein